MVDVGLLTQAEAVHAGGESVQESDEVGERVKQVMEPLLLAASGEPEALVPIGVLIWNCPLLPREEREDLIRQLAAMWEDEGVTEIRQVTMRVLVQRRRELFPDDARFIVDYRVSPRGNTFAITAFVVQRPQSELADFADLPPPTVPPPRMIDHIIEGPLVAHTSREHDAFIRKRSKEDQSLSSALQSLVDGMRPIDAGYDHHVMTVTLAAIAWNATQLSAGEERRVIAELCARMGDNGIVFQGMLMSFAKAKRQRFPDDHRLIAHCKVRGKPGNYRITARRWRDEVRLDAES
jgi:hypothetical protein